jgi:hypothetical protein
MEGIATTATEWEPNCRVALFDVLEEVQSGNGYYVERSAGP